VGIDGLQQLLVIKTRVPQQPVVSLGDVDRPSRILTPNDGCRNLSDDQCPSGDHPFDGLGETAIHPAVSKNGPEAL
jgi:hypothetical protein